MMMTPLRNYLNALGETSPIVSSNRLAILSMEAALHEINAEPEVIAELREGISDGIAAAIGGDIHEFDLRLEQVAKSINSLPLRK